MRNKKFSIIFLLASLMIYIYIVPICFEYSWTFYIMFISSIITLFIKDEKKFIWLIFINGIITCFFDFLTTEILTLLIPLLLLLFIYFNKDKYDLNKSLKLLLKSYMLWGTGYALTFVMKWLIASIVLNKNVMPFVKDNLMLRINGLQGASSKWTLYKGAITRNIFNLYPLGLLNSNINIFRFLIFVVLFVIVFFDIKNIKNIKEIFTKENIKKNWFVVVLLILALTPYIRYLLLANHSYRHSFFTFRDQLVTIVCLILLKFELNEEKYNGINNTNAMSKRRKDN